MGCAEGKYKVEVGNNGCTVCGAGKYSSLQMATSSSVCLLCREGKYSSAVGAWSKIPVSRVKQESILKSREPSLSWIASLVVRVNTRQSWRLPREQRVTTAQLERSPLLWQRLRKSHVAHVQQASFRRLLER